MQYHAYDWIFISPFNALVAVIIFLLKQEDKGKTFHFAVGELKEDLYELQFAISGGKTAEVLEATGGQDKFK